MTERNSKEKKIRVGIVGAGLMGKWHAHSAVRAKGEIVAITDIDQQKSTLLAQKYETAQCFKNVTDMLQKKIPDVIHICTPTPTHKSLIEQFVKAGVNVFVEKPLAQTAEETIYLYNLAEQHKVKMCPAHQFVFQKGIELAKNGLKSIGEPVHLEAKICSAGGTILTTENLNSIAVDILPHPLSLFQTLLSKSLPMNNWEVQHPTAGELRVFGQLREISLSIFVSLQARPTINSLRIYGKCGTIHLNLFHGFAFIEGGKVSKFQKVLHPFSSSTREFSAATLNLLRRTFSYETAYPGLQALISKFYQSIRTDRELPVTPLQAINIARVRDIMIEKQCNPRNH